MCVTLRVGTKELSNWQARKTVSVGMEERKERGRMRDYDGVYKLLPREAVTQSTIHKLNSTENMSRVHKLCKNSSQWDKVQLRSEIIKQTLSLYWIIHQYYINCKILMLLIIYLLL